jgi:hypothetical protein
MDPKELLLSGFQSEPAPRWNDANLAVLHRARYSHGAVVLPGQKVLVAGGYEEQNASALRSVEVHDHQHWDKKWPKLNQRRAEHATVMCNNSVVVLGGCNDDDGCLDSIEFLNLSAKSPKWKVLNAKLSNKIRGCTAICVGSYVYIIGGKTGVVGSCLDSVDILDTATSKVFKGPSLTTRRYGAAAAILGRTIYVVGGSDGSDKALDTIECLQLTGGGKASWQPCTFQLTAPRVYPAVTVVTHCVVVVGGRNENQGDLASVEVIDSKRNVVWKLSSLRQARYACAAVTLKNSRITVIGGNSSITGVFESMEELTLEILPIQTQITIVQREIKLCRGTPSLRSIFGRSKKKNRSKSSSLRALLKDLKLRADSQEDNDSWQSSDIDDDDELPVYDNGRIYAKKRLKDSGQAQVYKGIMEGNGGSKQTVAIKVFKRRSDWDDCKQELMTLLKMSGHENVMEILDFYEVPKPSFVMRFVAGGDLRDYLNNKGKMVGKQAIHVLNGIGQGLHHLHSNGIVHRDLKSLNILLERKGKTQTPVLIDLGLGKVMDKESAVDDEFQTVGCLGTSTHMAPEMASQGKWSSKTDMFAMGVIMWEVLTGEYPYRGMGWNQVLSFVVRKDGRPDNAGQMDKAKVSKANQEIIKSLWHKDPAVRPSAEEFLSRLEQSNGKT